MYRFTKVGRKIIGVGRNFAKHAAERGNAVPSSPMLFLKPTSSYLTAPSKIEVPANIGSVYQEIELGVIIGKGGRDISKNRAMDHVRGYCLALDMSASDIQQEHAKMGYPWCTAKGYDSFCPVSDEVSLKKPMEAGLQCKVNGEIKQDGNTRDLVHDIPALIENISSIFKLEEHDVILTGTPEGASEVKPGDVIEGALFDEGEEVTNIRFEVMERQKPT